MANNAVSVSPINKLKMVLSADSVKGQFNNALKENSGAFVASVIDLYTSDKYLQECDPNQVVMEALKAATLKLPINKQLGFAYIVPYSKQAQFQMGYKGYIQLAMRTGQYRFINADKVYEGQISARNVLTGEITFNDNPKSDTVIGYFAYIELLNGFNKTLFWSVDKVRKHAERYSKSYKRDTSAWKTNFDEMALKTVIRNLLSHYGILSVDMIAALTEDSGDDVEFRSEETIKRNANSEELDIKPSYTVFGDEPGDGQATDEPDQTGPDF